MTTITTNADALDLRRALTLRSESDELIERLQAGDLTAEPRARELLAIENGIIDEFTATMRECAGSALGLDEVDGVTVVVTAIGTGDLGYVLDVATGAAL